MSRRSILGFMLIVAALLALTAPALAGGWAVVTLDTLPSEMRAGETMRVGFTIRQHGQNPVNTDWDNRPLHPYLTATKRDAGTASLLDGLLGVRVAHAGSSQKGETIRVDARQEGPVGHFVADVVFPSDGAWEWAINAPPFEIAQEFEPLTVLPAVARPAEPSTSTAEAAAPAAEARSIDAATLRWLGAFLLVAAVVFALVHRRNELGRWLAFRSRRA